MVRVHAVRVAATFLYDGGIVPDPEGIITGGHASKTGRTVAIRYGEAVTAPAPTALFRQIIANDRVVGGWRELSDIQIGPRLDVGLSGMWDEDRAMYVAVALDLIALTGTKITEVVSFLTPEIFSAFGLPEELREQSGVSQPNARRGRRSSNGRRRAPRSRSCLLTPPRVTMSHLPVPCCGVARARSSQHSPGPVCD
jgi:hypothetical protein